jgi:pimeloyl-ACP methyl ester carboxylesterase
MTSILMQTWSTQMSEHAHIDGVYPFPALMQTRTIETNGTSIHVRVGGHGPAVVMLHGFGTTGDMWGHLASALIEDHMIVAPDLRGLGLSSKPDGGYDKKNQAADVVGVLDALGVSTAELVTHDIGIMVGFAVDALATRIASFDKQTIAETKRLVNVASLPPDIEIESGWNACVASMGRPATQQRIKTLIERGFCKPGDAENRLGDFVGR